MTKPKVVICPYCGESQPAEDWCRACGGFFDELSRQATHNDMGPWFIRNPRRPFHPGCSYETIIKLIERGQITKLTILRGPTTKQFWTIAKRVPGVAHLLGYCHSCDASVSSEDHGCPHCGVPFGAYLDRNRLGLPEVKPLPWEADGEGESSEASSEEWGGPESRGVSSFTRDGDTVNGAREKAALLDAPAPGSRSFESVAHLPGSLLDPSPSVHEPAAAAAQATTVSPAVRSLRRELARQRRLTTLLVAFLVVAFVVLLLTNLDALAPPTVSPGSGGTSGDGAATAPAPGDAARGSGAPTSSTERTGEPSGADAAAEEGIDVDELSRRVEAVLTQAEDPQRALAERIAACEAELKRLDQLALRSSDERIDKLSDRLRSTLEELRLRDLADPPDEGDG